MVNGTQQFSLVHTQFYQIKPLFIEAVVFLKNLLGVSVRKCENLLHDNVFCKTETDNQIVINL